MEPGATRLTTEQKWDAAVRLAVLIELNHRARPYLALLAWARWAERLDVAQWTEAMQIHGMAREMLIASGVAVTA